MVDEPDPTPSKTRRVLAFPMTRLVFTLLAGILLWGATHSLLRAIAGGPPFESLLGAFLNKTGQLAGPLGATIAIERILRGQRPAATLRALGLGPSRRALGLGTGFAAGGALMSAVSAVLAIVGFFAMSGTRSGAGIAMVGHALAFFFIGALAEEVLVRGILFRLLEEWLGTWAALVLAATVFGLMHLGNPNTTLAATLSGIVVAGGLLTSTYVLTRNLWFVTGMHWAWNFFQSAVFGVAVSGQSFDFAISETTMRGPTFWTGGAYGPEAGAVPFVLVAPVLVALLIASARRGRIASPSWRRRAQ
jgi:uncharacterized protein